MANQIVSLPDTERWSNIALDNLKILGLEMYWKPWDSSREYPVQHISRFDPRTVKTLDTQRGFSCHHGTTDIMLRAV